MPKRVAERELDFSLLPVIEEVSIFRGLSCEIENCMEKIDLLGETLNRARGAAMLFHMAEGHLERWRDEAFLIGGLCGFVSMGDALTRVPKKSLPPRTVLKITDSKNPVLHLMYLLRNANIHTTSISLTSRSITLISQAPKPLELTRSVVIISDLNIQQLYKKRETKDNYARQDLERAIAWFNEKQEVFGVSHLLVKGVEAFCSELIPHYT